MMFQSYIQTDTWIYDAMGGAFRLSDVVRFVVQHKDNSKGKIFYSLVAYFRHPHVDPVHIWDFKSLEEATKFLREKILDTK